LGATRPPQDTFLGARGPRLPFGDALAPKTVPELPQEGPGAKFTKNHPKFIKKLVLFLLELLQ